MTRALGLTGLLLVLLAAPAASAQADESCTQADPCPWALDVGATGFSDASVGDWNWTVGQWVQLSVWNTDNVTHTVHVPAFGITAAVAPDDIVDVPAFNLTRTGSFQVTDAPTGGALDFVVFANDGSPDATPAQTRPVVISSDACAHLPSCGRSATGTTHVDAPGLPLVLALAALGVAVVSRRVRS